MKLVPLHTLPPGSTFKLPDWKGIPGKKGSLIFANECRAKVKFQPIELLIEPDQDLVPNVEVTLDISPNTEVELRVLGSGVVLAPTRGPSRWEVERRKQAVELEKRIAALQKDHGITREEAVKWIANNGQTAAALRTKGPGPGEQNKREIGPENRSALPEKKAALQPFSWKRTKIDFFTVVHLIDGTPKGGAHTLCGREVPEPRFAERATFEGGAPCTRCAKRAG